jgi:hypothetical protein
MAQVAQQIGRGLIVDGDRCTKRQLTPHRIRRGTGVNGAPRDPSESTCIMSLKKDWMNVQYIMAQSMSSATASRLNTTPTLQETTHMDANEWMVRFSARLHAQWPRLPREQRDELAAEVHHERRWQQLDPENAAVEWLGQGIPLEGHRRAS